MWYDCQSCPTHILKKASLSKQVNLCQRFPFGQILCFGCTEYIAMWYCPFVFKPICVLSCQNKRNHSSLIGIVTRPHAWAGARHFPCPDQVWWPSSILFVGVKQLYFEAVHPHPCSAEVQNVWSYTFTPLCALQLYLYLSERNVYSIWKFKDTTLI